MENNIDLSNIFIIIQMLFFYVITIKLNALAPFVYEGINTLPKEHGIQSIILQ